MRCSLAVMAFTAVLNASGALAQTGRAVTGVGQTKPPSRDAAPPATSAPLDPGTVSQPDNGRTDEQKQAEAREGIRRGQERERARDRATDELFARWEFAVCVGCGPALKPFRRVWTNPLRVLAGVPATEDDNRFARPRVRWASLHGP